MLRLATGWTPTWTSSIISGDLEAAACLLIALLPNLEKLRIVDRWRYYDSPPFYSTLSSLFKAAKNPKRDLEGLSSLKKLSEVGLHGSGAGAGLDFAIVPGFSVLPSIRTIKGRYIDGETYDTGPLVKKPNSNITSLEFHQSSIDMGSFYDGIKRIKALRNFTYGFCAAAASGEQTWEPRGIIGVLQKFACRSLVHLELTGVTGIYSVRFRHGGPFIGSLRAFEGSAKLEGGNSDALQRGRRHR